MTEPVTQVDETTETPCRKCQSTNHTTGQHNSGSPAPADDDGGEMNPNGQHNSGRPV